MYPTEKWTWLFMYAQVFSATLPHVIANTDLKLWLSVWYFLYSGNETARLPATHFEMKSNDARSLNELQAFD